MADATPINRTLLFRSPQEFKAGEQFDFANADPSMFASKRISSNALPIMGRNMMVRNLDEVRRMPAVVEVMNRHPSHHTTGSPTTVSTNQSFPESLPSPESTDHSSTAHLLPPLEDHDDWVETQRWDEGVAGGQAHTAWSCPMEVLYQRYHVVIALDMSKATFEVSRNGLPFVDRIPQAIESILNTIALTLEARKVEVRATKAWIKAYLPQDMSDALGDMIWDPKVIVSIVFVNAPHRTSALIHQGGAPKHSSDHHTSNVEDEEEAGYTATTMTSPRPPPAPPVHQRAPVESKPGAPTQSLVNKTLLVPSQSTANHSSSINLSSSPPDVDARCTAADASEPSSPRRLEPGHVPFLDLSAFPFGVLDDSSDYSVERTFPLVVQCPAESIMNDETFVPRIASLMMDFENLYRGEMNETGEQDHWPEVNIDETIERALRFVPFDDEYCHTVSIVSNFAVSGCSETIALQESQVIRKNVILACLSLNRFVPWESPHLTPLGHFLIACGGFGLHVDQWMELSNEDVTTDWCQRFEGARCLAQQMFVQLVSKFPVVSPGTSSRIDTLIPTIRALPYLVEANLDVFRREGTAKGSSSECVIASLCTTQVLRMLSTARQNEGWSVVMDTQPHATSAHLFARLDHFLHKGSLTVFYEASVNPPMLYRKLKIQGTPALVRQLCAVQLEDRLVVPNSNAQASRHWHTYVALLRGLLDGWMRADDDLLALHQPPPSIGRSPTLKVHPLASAVGQMSRLQGCTAEWLSRFCVESTVCVFSYTSACSRMIDNLYGGLSTDGHARKGGLIKRPNDPLLIEMSCTVIQALAPLGFVVVQEALACNTPSAYNSKHCILARTSVVEKRCAGEAGDELDRCALDVVQAFIIDESGSGLDLVAATCEVRHSFSHRTPAEKIAVQEEVRAAMAAFSATRSTSSIHFDVIPLNSSCVARRAMCMVKHDLLSKWSDASGASSTTQLPSRAAAARTAMPKRISRHVRTNSTVASSAQHRHTVQYAAQRIFVLGAHGSELFLMKGTTSTRWSFGAFVPHATQLVMTTALMLLGLRREQLGFTVLHAHASGKRMLLRRCMELPIGRHRRMERVDLHDVLEVELSEGRWDLRVVRHISHHDRIVAVLGSHSSTALTQDIQQDFEVLSTVMALQQSLCHAMHEKDAVSTSTWSAPPTTRDVASFVKSGGKMDVLLSLEAIVPHLRADGFNMVVLQPPPSTGSIGAWELERGIYHVAANLGDEVITLPSFSKLHSSIVDLLCGSTYDDATHMVQVTRLSPRMGVPLLTILISICPNHRPAQHHVAGVTPHPTRVLVGTVDTSCVLYHLLNPIHSEVAPSQLDVIDVNSMRIRLQPTALTTDTLLLRSVEALLRAYATAMHPRSIHRECLWRSARHAPGTPTMAHSSTTMSETSLFPSIGHMSAGSPTDPSLYLQGAGAPPLIPSTELKRFYSSMIAYSSTVDITFMATLQAAGLVRDATIAELVGRAVQRRHGALRCLSSICADLTDGPLYSFDARHAHLCDTTAGSVEREESWDGIASEASSPGILKDLGSIEAEQVGCLVRLLLHKQYNDPAIPDELLWVGSPGTTVASSPTNASAASVVPSKVTLSFIAVTLPDALFDMSRNRFRPSGHMLRTAAKAALENFGVVPIETTTATKASADFVGHSPTERSDTGIDVFFAPNVSTSTAKAVYNTSIPLSRLPEVLSTPLESVADSIAAYIGDSAIELALLRSAPFLAAGKEMNSSSAAGGEGERSHDGTAAEETVASWGATISSNDAFDGSSRTSNSLVLFDDPAVLRRVLDTPGVAAFCRDVISPAFLCSKLKHQREEFAVEFTRTVRHGDAVDPFAATQQVFSQVLLQEGLCMLPTSQSSYLTIPTHPLFSRGVVMLVQLERRQNVHVDTVSILCFELQEAPPSTTTTRSPSAQVACSPAARDACAEMRRLISQKVAQVSQIHLLRELRDRERASEELLPQQWGDQFIAAAPDPAQLELKLRKATFLCPGKTVAEIPIYYRLQHQPKSILTKIIGNSHKMHLYRIYDREQCFVVVDDTAEDAFHIVRLVFVKVGAPTPNPMRFPPCLSDRVDVCNTLAIQVYSAHPNPKITHVIETLQDFFYLLAVQELQTRLKISMEKDLHAHDWTFLRYEKREPLTLPMMAGGQLWHPAIRDLAKWFLLRNMNECKFRFFATRDVLMNINLLPNSFLAHYQLHRGGESAMDITGSADGTATMQSIDSAASPVTSDEPPSTETELRFVKREEGSTDVLLSCGVHFLTEQHKIVVDVYTTKLPNSGKAALLERVAIMTKALRQCLSDTALHVNFFLAAQRTVTGSSYTPKLRTLHVRHAISLGDNLISMSHDIRVPELSILKRRSYDLKNVGLAHLGPLLERLVGLLQDFSPHLIAHSAEGPPTVVRAFPWSWMEERQNQHHLDHYFIFCGFQLVDDAPGAPGGGSFNPLSPGSPTQAPPSDAAALVRIRPTRAHAAAHPSFLLDTTTSVEVIRGSLQDAETPSSNLAALYDKAKIILHINLREGVQAVAFNMKDSETLLNLIGVVIHETSRKSSIHRDVLLQSLGYDVPTVFNEQDLARMCCGDQRNVQEPQSLSIMGEVMHRSAIMVRFPQQAVANPRTTSTGAIDLQDAFSMIVVGLSNRGTMVNHVFPYDGAVKVLFDDGPLWPIERCREAVDQLVALKVFTPDGSPLFGLQADTASHTYAYARNQVLHNFRIAMPHALHIPHTPLTANVYHRQLQRAHILIEAKNARAKVTDGVNKFERCWAARATCPKASLVRHIIQLQLKSKQVKGLRVPDFTLRTEALSAQDLYLESCIPAMTTDIQKLYCSRVDDMLRQYVNYLLGIFGDAVHVVEVDPSLPEFKEDPDIATRLRCRYGKVADREAKTGYQTFTPRLFFVVMTVADAMAAVRSHRHASAATADHSTQRGESLTASFFSPTSSAAPSSPLEAASSGFFVVEIGFQVVNYALDYFIIGGAGNTLHSDVNLAATLLKQRFLFSSVVYDLGVQRLVQQVLQPSQSLGVEQPVAVAAKNLVRYYPSPPGYSSNCVYVFSVTEPAILNLKHILVHPSQLQGSGPPPSQVIVAPHQTLRRHNTQDTYSVVGVLSWEASPKLYVILATTRTSTPHRTARRDMAPLLQEAKQLLTDQLLDATASLRAYDAWRQMLTVNVTRPTAHGVPLLLQDDFELIKGHSRVVNVTGHLGHCCTAEGVSPLISWAAIVAHLRAAAGCALRDVIVYVVDPQQSDEGSGCLFVTQLSTSVDPSEEVLAAAVLSVVQKPDGVVQLQLQSFTPKEETQPQTSDSEEAAAEVEELLMEAVSRLLVNVMWSSTFSSH